MSALLFVCRTWRSGSIAGDMRDTEHQLNGLQRLLRGDARHRTRLHTARGERLPGAAWRDIPAAVLHRLHAGQPTPWMVPAAVARLDRVLPQNAAVLELGSGMSSIWYAQHASRVTSLESDADWIQSVLLAAVRHRIENLNVILRTIDEFPTAVQEFEDSSFDLIVVDHAETEATTRVTCTLAAAPKLRPGGFLVVDDSDREHLQSLGHKLPGWTEERYVGVKARPLVAVETTLFRRPLD